MTKALSKMDKQTRFELCRKNLREYSDAYWGVMFEIWTDELWENEYDSFEEFRRAEVEYSERWVRKRLTAEGTKRLLDRNKVPVAQMKTAHFDAVAAVDDPKEQAEIVKEVLEKAKEEDRDPTTKDFKKAVKERMPEPESNGKAHQPEREPGEDDDKPLWVAGIPVVDGLRRQINELIKAVKACDSAPGLEMMAANRNRIVLDLDNAKAAIGGSIPYEACPYCNGIGAGCEGCKQRGWVNSIDWKHAPAEHKKATDLVMTAK